jgi:small multidrug resistance family-3 protein
MIKQLQTIHPFFFILICTILEATGDAIVRKCLYQYTGSMRIAFLFIGTVLLLGYGIFLNLAPVEFIRVVGLYVATLFVVWQVVNFAAFKTLPTLPVVIGGLLIVAGGLIVTFWNSSQISN